MWTMVRINGFDCEVKHYDEGSVFGINEGRISKLCIRKDGKIFANYDRGWDVEPTDDEAVEVYNELIKRFN